MKSNKKYYAGISLNTSILTETGVAVLDSELNLIKIDKFYAVSDVKVYIENTFTKKDYIISADLPENQTPVDGKWRYETKKIQPLKLSPDYKNGYKWTERHSDRGSDLCTELNDSGYEIYRYLGSSVKTSMGLISPYKGRTPQFAKFFQMALAQKYDIKGFSNNLLSLSILDAVVGAYLSYQIMNGNQTELGMFKELQLIGINQNSYSV